ncbi:MAG: hypothetical protein IKG70_01015 [Lachnospiraceae bacterium]|nr:hypothetical protein [Lachnospiraceae bacterium]
MLDSLLESLKQIFVDGILNNLSGLFDSVNNQVSGIAGQVGLTPSSWNGSIFGIVYSLSQDIILPIAGIILTFVMCYELIQIIIEKNNLHDIDTWIFFKWIFKTFVAVLIVSNTWNIVLGVFDVAQSVVNSSNVLISMDASVDLSTVMDGLEEVLMDKELGPLIGLWFTTLFVSLMNQILSICIFLVIYGRMIEIYLVTSMAPIPMATMMNREWGNTGQNYLRSVFALAFQGFLIMVCVGIYAVLIRTISLGTDLTAAMWGCVGYTVLLCFTLFKTGSLSKSIFAAH